MFGDFRQEAMPCDIKDCDCKSSARDGTAASTN
jgi:hypothetical protein